MLRPSDRFRPNEPRVAAEIMDGEAILIDQQNGVYFSADGAGAHVWQLVTERCSVAEIVESVGARFRCSPEEARNDTLSMLASLLREELICAFTDMPCRPLAPEPFTERLAYSAPELRIYRDLDKLLALDPPAPELQGDG
jgi:hypothetical protein